MSDYTNPEIAGEDKKARLKKQLLAGQMDAKTWPSEEFLSNYEVTTDDENEMKETVEKYGANPTEFKQFMSYVDQWEKVLWQVDEIKQNVLESDKAYEIVNTIAMVQETLLSIWNALWFKEEDMKMFALFDTVLNRLGFDGVKGYMKEHATHKHIWPLLKDYAALADAPESATDEPSVYGTVLKKLTSSNKEEKLGKKTMSIWASVDIHAMFTIMSWENTKQKNYLSAKRLDAFIPPYDRANYVTDEEKFMAASAYVMEWMWWSKLMSEIDDEEESDKLLWYMMTFLAQPKDAQKYFLPEQIRRKDEQYEEKMKVHKDWKTDTNTSWTENTDTWTDKKIADDNVDIRGARTFWGAAVWGALETTDLSESTAPVRRNVATHMHGLIAKDKKKPIWYKFGAWELTQEHELDCSGMVAEIFTQAWVDASPRTSRWFFSAHPDRTTLMENESDTGLSWALSKVKTWDLVYWNHTSEYTRKSWKKVPQIKEWDDVYNVHHIAMIIDTDPIAWTIKVLETNWDEWTDINIINVKEELAKNDQLIVSHMQYDQ